MSQEALILKGQGQWEEMVAFVGRAAKEGRPIEQVELGLWQTLLKLGHTLLASYVEAVGPGDVGETLTYEGRTLRRLEAQHERRYVSVFGELTISRCVYGTRETQKHEVVPADALLGLPEGEFSYLLQEWGQAFCVQGSYAQSQQTIERVLGLGQPVVCVMDGERALWKMLGLLVPGVCCILDIFHVLERLWQAAHCFHPEGSAAAREFVSDRLRRLLRGEVGYVIGGLKQMATKQKLRGAKARQLSAVIGYFHRHRRFMQYDEYLAAGFPIGSGVAEGACRHLVKDRMELTGMRWRTPGAQAMLDLRAVYINGDWDAFQSHRITQQRRRLYPYLALVRRKQRKAA